MTKSKPPKRADRGRVMVVDDDEVVLEVTRERLESAGYEVITRQSSLGTSAAASRDRPDYLLLDVNMPALAGDALARMIMATPGESPPAVILFSGDDPARVADVARRCGAVGAVAKTHDGAAFLASFERCVNAAARARRAR